MYVNDAWRKNGCIRGGEGRQLQYIKEGEWRVASGCVVCKGYLRPVRGCIRVGCVLAALAACCLGLLTFVLLLANSSRMVCGMSGSNLTPCCKKLPTKRSDSDFEQPN